MQASRKSIERSTELVLKDRCYLISQKLVNEFGHSDGKASTDSIIQVSTTSNYRRITFKFAVRRLLNSSSDTYGENKNEKKIPDRNAPSFKFRQRFESCDWRGSCAQERNSELSIYELPLCTKQQLLQKKKTYFPLLPPPFTRHPLNQSARKTIIVHKYLSKYKNRARSKQKEKIINKGRAKFWPFHPLLFFFEFCFVFVFHFEITMAFGYGVLDASEMITTILLFILEYAN